MNSTGNSVRSVVALAVLEASLLEVERSCHRSIGAEDHLAVKGLVAANCLEQHSCSAEEADIVGVDAVVVGEAVMEEVDYIGPLAVVEECLRFVRTASAVWAEEWALGMMTALERKKHLANFGRSVASRMVEEVQAGEPVVWAHCIAAAVVLTEQEAPLRRLLGERLRNRIW